MSKKRTGVWLPSIETARDLTNARGLDGLVMIGFANGTFSCASYGGTKQQCDESAALVDWLTREIELGVVPLESFDTGGIDNLPFIEQSRSEYDV